jgi:hypothetical protein
VDEGAEADADKSEEGTPVEDMQITLTVGETRLVGTLDDTEAARDFAELMPLGVRLTDFNGTEKISDLPRRLAVEKAPPGTDAQAGDIAYYAPWGNLALFYGDAPYTVGLVHLGRFDADAVAVLSGLNADTAAVVSVDGS